MFISLPTSNINNASLFIPDKIFLENGVIDLSSAAYIGDDCVIVSELNGPSAKIHFF